VCIISAYTALSLNLQEIVVTPPEQKHPPIIATVRKAASLFVWKKGFRLTRANSQTDFSAPFASDPPTIRSKRR
jgi:hypothetical protein